jgi:hypothetical protein
VVKVPENENGTNDNIKYGVVQTVIREGKHGPYAVAVVRKGDGVAYVTFSLTRKTWKGRTLPERGNFVVLSEINRKMKGWRAGRARFVNMEDDVPDDTFLFIGRKEVQKQGHSDFVPVTGAE